MRSDDETSIRDDELSPAKANRGDLARGWLRAATVAAGVIAVTGLAAPALAENDRTLVWSQQYGGEMDMFLHIQRGASGRVEQAGNDTSPSWAPGGGAIAFTSNKDHLDLGANGREIYVIAGNQVRRLTNNNRFDEHPDFSPRGDQITYSSADRSGRYQINTMTPQGDLKSTLTSAATNWDPSYSHDGRKITFMSTRRGAYSIYQMNADGSNEEELFTSANEVKSPSYSPDNGRILFTQTVNGQSEIYWHTIGAGVTSQVTNSPGFQEYSPRYSPDGRKIAFAGKPDGQNLGVYLVDYDGRNRVLISEANRYANWPDWLGAVAPAEPLAPADPAPQVDLPQPNDQTGPRIQMLGKPKAGRTHAAKRVKRFKGQVTDPTGVAKVDLAVKTKRGGKCRHLKPNGKLTARKQCANRFKTVANADGVFSRNINGKLQRGRYRVVVKATDAQNNVSKLRYRFNVR
jgi:Tol biopolymer transport system component